VIAPHNNREGISLFHGPKHGAKRRVHERCREKAPFHPLIPHKTSIHYFPHRTSAERIQTKTKIPDRTKFIFALPVFCDKKHRIDVSSASRALARGCL
jgi:hypothetical protein